MKRAIPLSLTTLRLFLGPLALACALRDWPRWLFAPILLAATLSDIYDGILARSLGVATPALRRYDSIADIIYYLFVLAALWHLCQSALLSHWTALLALLVSEAATILLSIIRFRAMPATHTYLAKLYGLFLFLCCAALLVFDAPGWSVMALAVIGLLANAEILAILCISKRAPVDVLSIFALPNCPR